MSECAHDAVSAEYDHLVCDDCGKTWPKPKRKRPKAPPHPPTVGAEARLDELAYLTT
jgi:hypothetical protein